MFMIQFYLSRFVVYVLASDGNREPITAESVSTRLEKIMIYFVRTFGVANTCFQQVEANLENLLLFNPETQVRTLKAMEHDVLTRRIFFQKTSVR
jgi:hypothetical protein